MKKTLFAIKSVVCCLVAMTFIFLNAGSVAFATEDAETVVAPVTPQQSTSNIALVEISGYEIVDGIIEAGRDVTVNVYLHNASTTTNAHNVTVSFSSASGMVYPSYGNDNQVYVGTIGPDNTRTAAIPLSINPDFNGSGIDITCSIMFESRGDRLSNSSSFVLPTYNGSSLLIRSIDVSPKAIVYGKSLLSVNYINNSADAINDAKLTITGNIDDESREIDLGAISPGKSYLKDFYITFVQAGKQGIDITLSYTDTNGQIVRTDIGSYSVSIEEDGDYDSLDDNSNRITLWIGRIVSLIALVAAFVSIFRYIKKR